MPGVAQNVGRGIALLFHDRGTRRKWVVSSTHRPHFTLGKDPVPISQEIGEAPGLGWSGRAEKSRPHRDSIPDRPALSHYTNWATWRTSIQNALKYSCQNAWQTFFILFDFGQASWLTL